MKVISLVVLIHQVFSGEIRYVDSSVLEKGDGSWDAPFKTISECAKLLKGPGDQCLVRGGTYREDIVVSGVRGEEENPAVISGYENERPVIDGTVEIKPLSGSWDKSGKIYQGTINNTIWQLFIDDTMMTNARWPNAKFSDQTIFMGNKWAGVGEGTHAGKIISRDGKLADLPFNVADAMAVLNIGKFNTFVSKVEHHTAGDDFFTYDHTFGSFEIEAKLSRFFLEDKLELLDVAEEWHFNKTTKVLTFIPPKGTDMENAKLKGKVQTYAFRITDSQHLTIRNLDLFATTIKASSESKNSKVDKLTFDSINFMYPSYSKRMLGDIGLIEWTDVDGKAGGRASFGGFKFINNYFYGTDGVALAYHGRGTTLKNNLFKHNDWTSANMLSWAGGMATIYSDSYDDTFTRNTLIDNGNGCGIRPGMTSNITFNYISGQCFGFQQNDGSGIQVQVKPQKRVRIVNNWVFDSPKYGIRFDGERPNIGYNGTVQGNVVLRTNGVNLKGDYHHAYNNLVLDSVKEDSKEGKCSLCLWKTVRRNLGIINQHSTVMSNIADVANGGFVFEKRGNKIIQVRNPDRSWATWPIQGSTVKNNLFGDDTQSFVQDSNNNDFRPVRGSRAANFGIGPYRQTNGPYWIPGREEEKASGPVPPTGSETVIAQRRRHVMWRNAYNCDKHQVYFGTSKEEVTSADTSSDAFIGGVSNGRNIKAIPKESKVMPGGSKMPEDERTVYYWRVDAVTESGEVIKGDVWNFSTI